MTGLLWLSARAARPSYSAEIQSVSPVPPYCVLRNGAALYERLLELRGQNFPVDSHQLQFRKVATSETSIHFAMEVNWESSQRITVDMARIKDLLWSDSKVLLTARITGESYLPVSDWSPEFLLADDAATCGIAQPTTISQYLPLIHNR
jgi:hypothetical protein